MTSAGAFGVLTMMTTVSLSDVIYGDGEAQGAFERVWFGLIVRLVGDPWHKSEAVIDEFRSTSLPRLLRSASA